MSNKTLEQYTNDELRSRINRGQKTLGVAYKVMFTAWTTDYIAEHGRCVAKFRKADLILALKYTAELYKHQRNNSAAEDFDDRTLSLKERTMRRAAAVRVKLAAAKEAALATGRAVKVQLGELRS